MNFRDFKNDIRNFIKYCKNTDSNTIKKEYHRLVKKYHPDAIFDNKETNNKYMVILNRIYSDVKIKKNVHNSMQYNSPRKKNKYQFVNRYNC
ncbi:DnaJ domain-containing protein, partial [Treponema pedis]|uniref:DnaJ domain-containing protein n=1 Tax=Treponema pedis TaxID=409322 RepID=UPI000466AF57